MKINGIGNLTNRLPEVDGRQKEKEVGREQEKALSKEQKALTAFTDELQQKMSKIKESGRDERIAAIAAKLENGSFSPDFFKLAKAMLIEGKE